MQFFLWFLHKWEYKMGIIKVENLYTAFGDNIVHENLSFNVKEGEIFGVLGGSGSGKTVLVKQIVMLNEIKKGTIKILIKIFQTYL